jgi:outer membrane protein assembly factor BamB
MPRTHRLALIAVLLPALMLAGCNLGSGPAPSSSTGAPAAGHFSLPTEPSVLVSTTMQNPGGIAAGYGKLTLVALDPGTGSMRWRYQTDWHPYQQVGTPLEAGGIVYTVSDPVPPANRCSNLAGNLVALRETDGRQLWSAPVGFLPTPPVTESGVVYTSALRFNECATPGSHQPFTRSYYALRGSDGHQLWRTDITADNTNTNPADGLVVDGSLQLLGGTLVLTGEASASEAGDRVGHLVAFDAGTGKLLWQNIFSTNQSIYSFTSNGLLYVRTHSGEEPTHEWTAYRASDGRQVWQVSGGYSEQFLVSNGIIYADASYEAANSTPQQPVINSQVVAVNPATEQQLWQVTSDTNDVNQSTSLLAVRDTTVYVQTGPTALVEKAPGHWRLEGLDTQTGHVRWSAPLRWSLGQVLLAQSALFGYSDDMLPGYVMALDPQDGHTIWSTAIDSSQSGAAELGYLRSLVLGDGILYAVSESSTVTAVRAEDGAALWKASTPGSEVEMSVVE